ncbi:MAG TPA: PTS fructose transporter subunit IIA [Lentisphaeria bacterium]|nr:MAG: PTS fructose transporter subunit IIA [Lentisphaerae bacterium GWF2_49_21]HBC86952.1 PTS fructose transporter subunit IIA [Lentisphaeria bacterium]
MQLTVHDVATYFNVSERTVYRWIDQKIVPAYKINDQFRFNRAELIEWAASQKINVSPDIFESQQTPEDTVPSISESVKSGGIFFRIEGSDKKTVLKNIVDIMKLPDNVDRSFLFDVLLARENMASTGIGEGIAIPHVRNPVVLNVNIPIITLCFLEKPIDFGALDKKDVFCLFTLISPSPRVHLQLISRLAFLLKNPNVRKILEKPGTREEILKEIEKAETKVNVK